ERCPHCEGPLERKAYQAPTPTPDNPAPRGGWVWMTSYGYLCRNTDCSYTQSLIDPKTQKNGRKPKRRGGAAWFEEAAEDSVIHRGSVVNGGGARTGSGYVDLERKAHVLHMFTPAGKDSDTNKWHGRECTHCRHVR